MHFSFTSSFLKSYASLLRMAFPAWGTGVGFILGMGVLWGWVENVSLRESLYFSLVTAMTIGYGDLVPTTSLGRLLALAIGFIGLLTTGLLVAVSLQAVRSAFEHEEEKSARRRRGRTP